MGLRDDLEKYVTPEGRARVEAFMAESDGDDTEPEVYVTTVKYRVTIMPEKCRAGSLNDLRHWTLYVRPCDARTGADWWLVTDGGDALGRDGSWDMATVPHPDDATEDMRQAWRANYCHATLHEALAAAREHAPKMTINGLTAVEVLARHRARNLECCRG